MASSLRIGAVSFINSRPLIRGLERRRGVELTHDVPGALADALRVGNLDAALVPVVEYMRGVGKYVVPGISIACRGQVRSVRLVSRVPANELEAVSVDRGSRTSVALLRVLLSEMHGVLPDFHIFRPGPDNWFERFQAALVIGDDALRDVPGVEHDYDLGRQWTSFTSLPFVFAFWVYRDPELSTELSGLLREARDAGLADLEAVADEASRDSGFERGKIFEYLSRHLHYDLGKRELTGLELFNRYCLQYHLVPRNRVLQEPQFAEQIRMVS
jgi:chorismate dehydratase